MTSDQIKALDAYVTVAERDTRDADMWVNAPGIVYDVDPELRGHISIALQHLQMALVMVAQMARQEVTHE